MPDCGAGRMTGGLIKVGIARYGIFLADIYADDVRCVLVTRWLVQPWNRLTGWWEGNREGNREGAEGTEGTWQPRDKGKKGRKRRKGRIVLQVRTIGQNGLLRCAVKRRGELYTKVALADWHRQQGAKGKEHHGWQAVHHLQTTQIIQSDGRWRQRVPAARSTNKCQCLSTWQSAADMESICRHRVVLV
jgi:hypothetical protein